MRLWVTIVLDKDDDPKTIVEDVIVHALKNTFANIHVERIGDTILVYKRS